MSMVTLDCVHTTQNDSLFSVEQAAKLVKHVGHSALMAKVDLSSTYRRIPVHPVDHAASIRAGVAGGRVPRHSAPVWAPLSPENIHRSGRCPHMGNVHQGDTKRSTLPRRLSILCFAVVARLCPSHRDGSPPMLRTGTPNCTSQAGGPNHHNHLPRH